MRDKNNILAVAEALHIRQLYPPFSLPNDGPFDLWIADVQFIPKEDEYQTVVRAALDILKPQPAERPKCREHIRYAIGNLNRVEAEQSILSPRSKKSEGKIKQLTAALNKARVAHKHLPPLEQTCFDEGFDLAGAIAFCEQRTSEWNRTPMPKARTSHRQRAAVEAAYKLVEYWLVKKRGLERAVTLTRKNEWHKVSAILFGNAKIDLLDHMRHFQQHSCEPDPK